MGLGPGDRHELVMTVLGDVVLQLHHSTIMPKDLARYLVSALRNRIRSRLRDASRAVARSEQASSAHGAAGQRVVAECHSAYGLRLAEGHGEDAPALSRAIRRLAEFSAQSLSTLDASLMVGLSNYVPLRELAGREGITYGAARVRVHRLRERFRKLAVQHLATLDVTERQELQGFFRRAGVVLDTAGGSERVGDDKETER